MNYKAIVKIASLALFTLALAQAASAMEKPQEELNADLLHAARRGDINQVIKFLGQGADINYKNNYMSGWTPLIWASWNNHLAIAQLLLKYGADINCKDIYGETALNIAHNRIHIKIAALLINEPQRRAKRQEANALVHNRIVGLYNNNPHIFANYQQHLENNTNFEAANSFLKAINPDDKVNNKLQCIVPLLGLRK